MFVGKVIAMSTIEDRVRGLGYILPNEATPVANYLPTVRVAGEELIYVSGHLPRNPDGNFMTGKLGADLTIEQGYEGAKMAALAMLGSLKSDIGDLDRVKRIVKLLCMVNCTPDFEEQPAVANGASDLLVQVFGEKGRHARSAVGIAALPGGACVEIEMIVQVSS